MIYFVQAADGGPIKIGTTRRLRTRVKALEWMYGVELVVLRTIKGGRDEEREMHSRFAHLRIGKTEQFRPEPDLMEFVGRPPIVLDGSIVIEAMATRQSKRKTDTPFKTIGIRCTKRWAKWLKSRAKSRRTTITGYLQQVAEQYAKDTGFFEPPPIRLP